MKTILIKEAELDRDGNIVISYSDKFDKIEGVGYTSLNNLKIELHNENVLDMNDNQIQDYILSELSAKDFEIVNNKFNIY